MKRSVAAVVAALALTAAASAQSYPGDSGAGTQRGLQQLNNSGQVGTVTLFRHGPNTRIVIELHGTSPGRAQSVRVVRGRSCDELAAAPTYFLADLRNGVSRSAVMSSEDRLLSGNYNVVAFASTRPGAPPTSCGHLDQ